MEGFAAGLYADPQVMAQDQKIARIFGVLFILTFITSIGALALFQSVLDDPALVHRRRREGEPDLA